MAAVYAQAAQITTLCSLSCPFNALLFATRPTLAKADANANPEEEIIIVWKMEVSVGLLFGTLAIDLHIYTLRGGIMSDQELYKFFWNYNRVHEIYDRTKNEKDRQAVERYQEEWEKRFAGGLDPKSDEFKLFMKASDDFEEFLGSLSPQSPDEC